MEIVDTQHEVHFGEVGAALPDWRADPDVINDEDPDDELLPETPEDVVAVLGFDPLDLELGDDEVLEHLPGKHDQDTHGKSGDTSTLGNAGSDKPRRNVGTVRKGAITPKEAGELDKLVDFADGFTYQPVDDNSPQKGFSVSPFPEATEKFPGDVSPDQIFDYLIKHKARFVDPRINVGAWYDSEKDEVVLDLSIVVGNQTEATRIGNDHDQDAIYDLASGTEIFIR